MMLSIALLWPFVGQILFPWKVRTLDLCGNNSFFDSVLDACVMCSRCDAYSVVRRPCSRTSDTECVACVGDGIEEQHLECERCPPCPAGQYVARPCSPNHRTVCQRCPDGMFNPKTSYSSVCVPCTYCENRRQREISLCTSWKDSVCGHCEKGFYSEFGSSKCVPCRTCAGSGQRVIEKCQMDGIGRDCERTMSYNAHLHSIEVPARNMVRGENQSDDKDVGLLFLPVLNNYSYPAEDKNATQLSSENNTDSGQIYIFIIITALFFLTMTMAFVITMYRLNVVRRKHRLRKVDYVNKTMLLDEGKRLISAESQYAVIKTDEKNNISVDKLSFPDSGFITSLTTGDGTVFL